MVYSTQKKKHTAPSHYYKLNPRKITHGYNCEAERQREAGTDREVESSGETERKETHIKKPKKGGQGTFRVCLVCNNGTELDT